jgi:hypothetical protein
MGLLRLDMLSQRHYYLMKKQLLESPNQFGANLYHAGRALVSLN